MMRILCEVEKKNGDSYYIKVIRKKLKCITESLCTMSTLKEVIEYLKSEWNLYGLPTGFINNAWTCIWIWFWVCCYAVKKKKGFMLVLLEKNSFYGVLNSQNSKTHSIKKSLYIFLIIISLGVKVGGFIFP